MTNKGFEIVFVDTENAREDMTKEPMNGIYATSWPVAALCKFDCMDITCYGYRRPRCFLKYNVDI